MYNPEGFELPDYDDPYLTEYVYGYDVLFTHVIGFNSKVHSETPFVDIEFGTPFYYNVPFHFLMWPETPTIVEEENLFALEYLNPDRESFVEAETQVLKSMDVTPEARWRPSVRGWFREANDEGCDTIAVLKYRVRYEWDVRAFAGLTLDHLERELYSTDEALEFTKDFVVPEGVVLLLTLEPEDLAKRPDTLEWLDDSTHSSLPGSFELPINSLQPHIRPSNLQDKKGLWSRMMSRFEF